MLLSLPNELLFKIVEYFPIKDAKSVSQTCKRLHLIAVKKIWNAPKFKKRISVEQLKGLLHLPIKELHTKDLEASCLSRIFVKTFQNMTELTTIHVDERCTDRILQVKLSKKLMCFEGLSVDIIIHTHAMEMLTEEEFDDFEVALKSIQLKHLIVDHKADFKCNRPWGICEFRRFMKFPMKVITVKCLDIKEDNVDEFIGLLSSVGSKCSLDMQFDRFYDQYLFWDDDTDSEVKRYNFRVGDLENMIKHKLKVTRLSTSILRTERSSHLKEFSNVLEKFTHLKQFDIDEEDFLDLSTLKLLGNLPVKCLCTTDFDLAINDVDIFIGILSNMNQLECLTIDSDEPDFRLTPAQLKKFSILPVKYVEYNALDVKESNVKLFRAIMKKMKIEKIYGSPHIYTFHKGGECFKTI